VSLRDLAAWEASASRGPEPVEAAASLEGAWIYELWELDAIRAARHSERQEIAAYLYARADERQGASRALLLRIARNVETGTYKQTNEGSKRCCPTNTQK
jgi:hypothetical protein